MSRPTCANCGGEMTPQNARLRPELFLHDACLPNEFRVTGAGQCPHCGAVFTREAIAEAEIPGKIPNHKFNMTMTDCPGSGQGPRNPLTDRRPLWNEEKKTLAQQVDDLAFRCHRIEGVAGEMFATIKLNVERGYLIAFDESGKLDLTRIIASWEKQLRELGVLQRPAN